jgi:lysophospholipase
LSFLVRRLKALTEIFCLNANEQSVFLAAATALASNSSNSSTSTNTQSYAPYYVNCPENLQLVRKPRQMSLSEYQWVHNRKAVVAYSLGSYLDRLNISGFDSLAYMDQVQGDIDYNVPVIAWATSGGGFRSAVTGIGGLNAIDERTPGANEAKVGGLYQVLTYVAGLSGGSWPTVSPVFNNYASISDVAASWHIEISRFTAENYTDYAAPVDAYFEQVAEKYEAGFNISTADVLGRGFAYEFIPGVNVTFSSIADLPGFKTFAGPMPMLISSSINKTTSPVEDGLYVPSWEAPWVSTQGTPWYSMFDKADFELV